MWGDNIARWFSTYLTLYGTLSEEQIVRGTSALNRIYEVVIVSVQFSCNICENYNLDMCLIT